MAHRPNKLFTEKACKVRNTIGNFRGRTKQNNEQLIHHTIVCNLLTDN